MLLSFGVSKTNYFFPFSFLLLHDQLWPSSSNPSVVIHLSHRLLSLTHAHSPLLACHLTVAHTLLAMKSTRRVWVT